LWAPVDLRPNERRLVGIADRAGFRCATLMIGIKDMVRLDLKALQKKIIWKFESLRVMHLQGVVQGTCTVGAGALVDACGFCLGRRYT
jgi:hypothetical protein